MVAAGYKQTEVGVIPEDWDVLTLGEVGSMKSGATITSESIKEIGHYPCYGGNGRRGYIDNYTHSGDHVLIGRQGALCGNINLAEGEFFASEHAIVLSNFQGFAPRFFNHLLIAKNLNRYSESSAQPGLSASKISKILFGIPPTLGEQEAIADALSDADAWIESLEQLIHKKRQIKQGAMQELLSPWQKQENGNPPKLKDGWVEKVLPDVCRFNGGKAHEPYVVKYGDYICVNSKFISSEGSVKKYCSKNLRAARSGDILMVMSDLPNGKALAKTFIVEEDNLYAINQRICALSPYADDSKFLSYILNRNPYFLKFDDGVNQTHLLNKVFERCPIYLPSIKIQTRIAKILSDMDVEITTLEQKREKARQLKQGMMQELLTGKTRLI